MLSLSTAWFNEPKLTTADVLAEVKRLGFRAIEWGVSGVRLDESEVLAAVRAGNLEISSVHAVADYHEGLYVDPRGGQLGSADSLRRQGTVEAHCRTIERARRLGAKAVVLHAGGISEGPLPQRFFSLLDQWRDHGETPAWRRELEKFRQDRDLAARPYLDRTIASLREIIKQVGEFPMGIESRYYLHEFPLPPELEEMWAALGSPCFGYWHDVGHARMMQLFGGVPEMSWIDRYTDRLLGLHIHDMIGIGDHRPPGTGKLDLRGLAARLKGHPCQRVVELNHRHTRKDVIAGREYLEAVGM